MPDKKYFYMRLKEDFFDSEELVILESLPDGFLYSNILLKLYLKSLKQDGMLMFNGVLPYTPLIIARLTRQKIDVVAKALEVLQHLGFIEIANDGAIYMLNVQEYVGKSSTEAERIRQFRERIKSEAKSRTNVREVPDINRTNVRDVPYKNRTNVQETPYKCPESIYIDIPLDMSMDMSMDMADKENAECEETTAEAPEPKPPAKTVSHKYGQYENVRLTDEDMSKLKSEFPADWETRIERLSEYMASKGATYKNHLATIRAWARKDKAKPPDDRRFYANQKHVESSGDFVAELYGGK